MVKTRPERIETFELTILSADRIAFTKTIANDRWRTIYRWSELIKSQGMTSELITLTMYSGERIPPGMMRNISTDRMAVLIRIFLQTMLCQEMFCRLRAPTVKYVVVLLHPHVLRVFVATEPAE